MKRIVAVFLVFMLFTAGATAQTGRCNTIMKNVAEKYAKSGGILINFTMTTRSGDKVMSRTSGNIKLKGDKFAISTPEMESWYNGKNAWSYMKDGKEVNLTEPDQQELININPYILLRDYKKRFECSYGGKQDNLETVVLKPVDASDEIKNAKITIDVKHLYPTRIEVTGRNNLKTVVNITGYKSEMNFDNATFVFDQKRYPDIEIIDLR